MLILQFFFFSPKMSVRLFILSEVKLSLDSRMIKLLTLDNLFAQIRLSSFPAKMMLVHARAILSTEKISYSKSSSNLKLSNDKIRTTISGTIGLVVGA